MDTLCQVGGAGQLVRLCIGYSDVKDRVGTVSRRHGNLIRLLRCWSISIGSTSNRQAATSLPYGRGSVYIYAAGITESGESQAMGPRHWVLAQWRAH
jgi:hypothetical protein